MSEFIWNADNAGGMAAIMNAAAGDAAAAPIDRNIRPIEKRRKDNKSSFCGSNFLFDFWKI